MKMTLQHFEYIADKIGPLIPWPSHLHTIADELEKDNPKFNRAKFIERGTTAWEKNFVFPVVDDEIPY